MKSFRDSEKRYLVVMAKKTLILFCAVLTIKAAANFCMKEDELSDEEFHYAVRERMNVKGKYRVIASECPDPKDNSTCLYVLDRAGYFENGEWFVARFLTSSPNLRSGFLSVSRLQKPVFKSKSSSNTENWLVDIGTMDPITPNCVEFVTLFLSGHFPTSVDISGNITFLGVATAGLMSFMGLHFKNLNLVGVDIDPQSEYLAKKWFGYKDRKNSKILIDDGAKYIREMAERGETVSAVMIDACHNIQPDDGLYCPVEAVRTPEFLNDLSKVIGSEGISIFNVYSMYFNDEMYEKMRATFNEHFVQCNRETSKELIGNVFLVCSNKQFNNVGIENREVQKFLGKLRIESFMKHAV